MRILIVSHPPIEERFGAAQLALGLAFGLRESGHDVRVWSPSTLLRESSAASADRRRGPALAELCAREGPFDVVDAPAIDISYLRGSGATLVARSVQPDLRYARIESIAALRRFPHRPSTWRQAAALLRRRAAIERGWRDASHVLCLGSLELEWMRARYPGLIAKMSTYIAAPLPVRRASALVIRAARNPERRGAGRNRFVWIGRWTTHKGTEALVRWMVANAGESQTWTVTLAGCGLVNDRRIAKLVASGRVEIVPEFASDDWVRLLGDQDAGLFTSQVEGWGLSLQEMLEIGLPVFATHAGAAADLEGYFPTQLRRFPPDLTAGPVSLASDPLSPDYLRRFEWRSIAREYLDRIGRAGVSS